jgi:transcriptional regulator of acetoin/glycerol metabolism
MARGPKSKRPTKDALIQLYARHGTTAAVARELNVSRNAVHKYCRAYGLTVRRELTQEMN